MKDKEVFFVSKEYEQSIKAHDFYDEPVTDIKKNIVKEIEFINNILFLKLSHFNYSLKRQYYIKEIYINNDFFEFDEPLTFDIKSYKCLDDNSFELIVYIDQEIFWEALKNEH